MKSLRSVMLGVEEKTFICAETNCLSEDNPDANYAGDVRLWTRPGQGKTCHVILRFDMSSMPRDAEIISATFGIYETSIRPNQSVSLHCLAERWTQSGSNWNRGDGTTIWSVPGGSYDKTRLGSFHTASTGFKAIDVTSVVRGWVKSVRVNNGFILVPTINVRDDVDSSIDQRVIFDAPYMDIAYTMGGPLHLTPYATWALKKLSVW